MQRPDIHPLSAEPGLSSERGWRGLLLATILFLVAYALLRGPLQGPLEDWTGETDLWQQMEGLVALVAFQRQVNTADLVPVAHTGLNPYGANTFLEQEVEEWKLRQSMEMLRAAGARWLRQQMPWDRIEIPAKGRYESPFGGSSWASYDRFIDLAREYGLEIVARLDLPPTWAKPPGSLPQAPPRNFEDYGDFVYTFVKRYQGKIRYYQIWNEPNLYSEWGDVVDAQRYVELLKIAYTRAKEADPQAVIIAGALAQTLGSPDLLNESDVTFLQKMYQAGAKGYFDILSVQGHGLFSGPGDRRTEDERTNLSRLRLLREVMVRHGDAAKALWLAELGWDALPPDYPGEATHGRVTPEQQARYTVQAYQRAQEEWPWVGVLFYWHFRRVHEENRQDVDFYYRMVDPDFTPHPVYHAYRAMTAQPPYVPYGYHQEEHWALRYEGGWKTVSSPRAVLGSYRLGAKPGDTLSFTFRGTDLSLVLYGPESRGRVYVTVDGNEAGATELPLDPARRAYLDLSAPHGSPVPLVRGLPYREHAVRLKVAEDSALALDGLIVDRDNRGFLKGGLAALASLGLLATLGLLAARTPPRKPGGSASSRGNVSG